MTDSTTRSPVAVRPIDVVWMAMAVLVPMIDALWSKLGTVDLAYHLRLGEQILAERAIPTTDTLTFTMFGTRWVDQQWGAQIALSALHDLGGWPGLVVARAVLVGASLALVLLSCRARGASPRAASLMTLAAYLMARPSLELRPQLLAVFLVCLSLWLLATRHRGCRRLVALPAIVWVCATLHGGFLVILLLVAAATVTAWLPRSTDRSLVLAAAVASFVVTFLTPLGSDLWTSAFGSASDPLLRELIPEWQRTTLATREGVLLAISALALAVAMWRSGLGCRRLVPVVVPLLPMLAIALSARRGLLWWALVAPVVAAELLPTRARPTDTRESRAPAIALIAALLAVVVAVEPFHRADPPEGLLRDAPTQLADALDTLTDNTPATRVFADPAWASWLEHRVPAALQFFDSRLLLTDEIVDDYIAVGTADARWREVMARWSVDAIALPPDWRVVDELRGDGGWTLVHEDDESVLFVRSL